MPSTLGSVSRRYAHRIPFIVKLNHNELLTFPNKYDQIMFANVHQAAEMGAAAREQASLWTIEEGWHKWQEAYEHAVKG